MKRKPREKIEGYFREDQGVAMAWCISKAIKIHYEPTKYNQQEYKIIIWDNGNEIVSGELYNKKEVATMVYKLYCHLYDKRKGKIS